MNLFEAASLQDLLRRSAYPGRGLAVGVDIDGFATAIYWVTGRSSASQNRRAFVEGTNVRVGPSEQEDGPSDPLRHYTCLMPVGNGVVVGNGSHVGSLAAAVVRGSSFSTELLLHDSEPDAPIFTPRVAGIVGAIEPGRVCVGSARRVELDGSTEHLVVAGIAAPGTGLAVMTYLSDGNDIHLDGVPQRVLLPRGGDLLDATWEGLDLRFAVLAVCWHQGGVTSRHRS